MSMPLWAKVPAVVLLALLLPLVTVVYLRSGVVDTGAQLKEKEKESNVLKDALVKEQLRGNKLETDLKNQSVSLTKLKWITKCLTRGG